MFNFEILQWNLDEKNCCKYYGNKIPIQRKLSPSYKEPRFEFVV